jgi:hypothetical protein
VTAPLSLAAPARRRRAVRMLGAAVLLAALTACAAPAPRVDVPAELPLRVNDQLFTIRYALQREPAVVRAVGQLVPSIDAESRVTLALFGVDAAGRVESRGTAYLRSEFGTSTIPFAVELTPTGRETAFELRVLHFHVPALRAN